MESSTDTQKSRRKRAWALLIFRKIRSLLSIEDDTDIQATIASIQKSVEFRGINVWILFFAIIIASIGLNVNSTAVIIGAMLISPLMGPINGLGLAVGTFDMELLRKSFRNLGLMVCISLFASMIYFLISPLSDAQSELLARTRPTIFDVLIAIFGGLAGIVASSRKEQPFTIISGVAIATALMPPLCTAGFGLATFQFRYFFGAIYLFFINSFFIAFATFVIVRYLKFPIVKFVNPQREKLVKRSIIVFALIVMIPSLFTAISVIKEEAFYTQVSKYVTAVQTSESLKDVQLIRYEKTYNKKAPVLTLTFVGDELSQNQIDSLHHLLAVDYGLASTQLQIKQASHVVEAGTEVNVLGDMLALRERQIQEQKNEIQQLKDSISVASGYAFVEVAKNVCEKYKGLIGEISISNSVYVDSKTGEEREIPTVYVRMTDGTAKNRVRGELSEWLPLLLGVDNVRIIME